jgi:hypothetical protein
VAPGTLIKASGKPDVIAARNPATEELGSPAAIRSAGTSVEIVLVRRFVKMATYTALRIEEMMLRTDPARPPATPISRWSLIRITELLRQRLSFQPMKTHPM